MAQLFKSCLYKLLVVHLHAAFKMSSHPSKKSIEVEGTVNAGPVGGKAKIRSEYENPPPLSEDTDDLHKQVGVGATVGTVVGVGVGGGIGAVIGAVVGSIVPGPGTVIGAAVGAAAGAAIGGGAGTAAGATGGAIHHAAKDKR